MRASRPGPLLGSGRYDSPIVDTTAVRSRALQLLAGLIPVAVAAAWLPLRGQLPNTDLALVLVVTVAGAGSVGGRPAVALGAIGSGLAFDLLHTTPYGELAIHSGRDVLTTAFLVVAGLVMGEVAVRLGRYRRRAEAGAEAFSLVTGAAGLVATGSEAGLVIEALTTELMAGLSLVDCSFETGPPNGDVPFVGRDASIVCLDGSRADAAGGRLDLPVWSSGEIVGRFRLVLPADRAVGAAQLQLAVGIADQAGAALHGHVPPPPPDAPRRGGLRLVRG